MQDWLKIFHGGNQAFPAVEIAVKVAVALALGLLVGFEREWSTKDIGVRTFAMTALLGLLGTLLGPPLLILSGVTVWILIRCRRSGFSNYDASARETPENSCLP
jgi:MgtC family